MQQRSARVLLTFRPAGERRHGPVRSTSGAGRSATMVLWCVLGCAQAAFPSPNPEVPATTVTALRVEMVTRGVPDPRPGQPSREQEQVLIVADDGKRVVLEVYSPVKSARELSERYILRLDRKPPVLWQLTPDNSKYVESTGDLNKIQRDRDIRERTLVRKISRIRDRRERERLFKDHHLKADNTRDVVLRWGESKKILDRDVKRLIVSENERTIIDCYVSEGTGGGKSFFDLYSRLGAFSRQVLEEIEQVRGLPLEGAFTVVTKLTAHELSFKVKKIEDVTVNPDNFELGDAKKVEQTNQTYCAHCGKPGEKKRMVPLRSGGRLRHFCNPECRRAYYLKSRKGPELPLEQRSAPSGGAKAPAETQE